MAARNLYEPNQDYSNLITDNPILRVVGTEHTLDTESRPIQGRKKSINVLIFYSGL
jgi:hypothetical protein